MKHFTYPPSDPVRTVAAVAIVFAICAQRTYGQDISSSTASCKPRATPRRCRLFREGRDFIEAQNWQKAAEKFNDFITGYPKDKDLDAALYWYGYALRSRTEKKKPPHRSSG